MLDALVDRQNREVARVGESAVAEHRLHVTQHVRRPVGILPDARDEVRPRQMQTVLGNTCFVLEQRIGVGAEQFLDVTEVHGNSLKK
jgi:hypothetical protein